MVSVRSFLEGPIFKPLKGPAFFRQVKVDLEAGNVVWPNGAGLDPGVLYAGSVPLVLPEEVGA